MRLKGRVEVPFTKIQGLGNEYLFIDRFAYKAEHDWSRLSRVMADRHFGAGSDGIILIEPSELPGCDFRMRIFNADGSEGDMCGNGMRSFAGYVYDHGLTRKTEFAVETGAGIIRPHLILKDGEKDEEEDREIEAISVDMGVPCLERDEIPLSRLDGPVPAINEPVEVDGEVFYGTAVCTGNPHFVVFVDDVWEVELEKVGPKLERHPLFPARANIEFATVKSRSEIDMRVWERGSGITLACGTGACAVLVAAVLNGKADKDVPTTVNLPGGSLTIEWKSDGHVWMTGPAKEVYRGVFYYEE